MANNVSNKSSSLLDALDSSFLGSTGEEPEQFSSQQTPPRRNPLQNKSRAIPDYFEPNPISEARRELETARNMQRISLNVAANNDADLLSGLHSQTPRKASGGIGGGGFRLNYDQETPLRSIDIGGPDQQQRLAEFVTKSIDNLSHGLTVKAAMAKLGLRDLKDLLPGLEVRLLSHQAIGVAWMLEKEKSIDKGGILADDMGLGKTVQMIATMAMNMPSLDDDVRTTLIVVPAALLQQWKDEIDTKTNGLFTVHVHHGRDKLKKASDVKSKDVIVTSYQTLSLDFSIPKDVEPDEEAAWLADNGGVLTKMKFFRVIADEAQFIRNRSTRASISLAYVKAKYRWMLTGTPVTNTLADIYGLLRFGRFRPWNDWNYFNERVATVQFEDAPLAGSRAQAILKPILLRRTKDSTLEGQPILQLPPKEIELVTLKFSPEERDLYDSFEKSTKVRLNKFIRERTLLKFHAAVLVMILRLRQLCCHPNLILTLANDYEDPTLLVASDSDKELGRAKKVMGASWVADLKKRFLLRAAASELLDFSDEDDASQASCPVCQDVFVGDSGRILACGHEICFDCTLELSNSPIVHDGIFGHGSEMENLAIEKEYETAVAKGYRPCPTCRKMMDLGPSRIFKASAFEPSDEELTNHARSKRQANRGKARGRDGDVQMRSPLPSPVKSLEERGLDDSDDDLPDVSAIFEERPKKRQRKNSPDDLIDITMDDISAPITKEENDDSDIEIPKHSQNKDRPSDAVFATWRKGDDDLEPSAKMLALIDYLKEWESTGEKTICYSQWTSMLDLIEILFSRHGIRSLRFDGKMGRESRDNVLAQFKKVGGPKVILISTKCGSVGLNLVSANRIINMDLSWNYAAESQAYDRCHRIGQDKPVYVKRLVVENTIEERMLRLQDVKVGLAEAALGEGTGAKLHKLSVKDIKYLFGMAPAKKDGNNKRAASRHNDDDDDK
ncbi:SNF2 family DNA-dependent ATPase [Crucibulum laeve]|uniref:SNF2 family DNA-dependent ATPase n=1 Tax=Crucibulum laeve TaxID=68775 RepID=A0A5C3LXV5_9AGAR|nr:SNF2 family DNA-dependent ATPase [Crucibulum laeve]